MVRKSNRSSKSISALAATGGANYIGTLESSRGGTRCRVPYAWRFNLACTGCWLRRWSATMSETLREAWYSGHVQGVGFRYTTWSIARGYSVTGFVENLPDGRVHLVVEGTVDQVKQFLGAIADRMSWHISEVKWLQRPATGQYREFEIRS